MCFVDATYFEKLMLRIFSIFAFVLASVLVQAQCPAVNVTASDTFYCHSDSVRFAAAGIPAGSTIEWNMGSSWDTGTAIYSTISKDYGNINLRLRLSLSGGTVCNYSFNNITFVQAPLSPTFSASRLDLCYGPDTLILVDQTIGSSSRSWVIDGQTFTNTPRVTTVQVSNEGIHDISMIVDDPVGCRTLENFIDTLVVRRDINLSFSFADTSHCLPYTTSFAAQFDTGVSVQSIQWYIQGTADSNSTLQNVNNVTYSNPGIYDVGLTVTRNNGCVYQVYNTDTISLGYSQNLALTTPKTSVCLSEEVVINQTTTPVYGYFRWSSSSGRFGTRAKNYAELALSDTGYQSVTYKIDHNNCVSRVTVDSILYGEGLKSDFTSDNNVHCDTPYTVNFVNTSDTVSRSVDWFEWNIYNENDSLLYSDSTKDLSYTVTSMPANFDVELITADVQGCKDTLYRRNFISIEPYDFRVEPIPAISCPGSQVKFINRTRTRTITGVESYNFTFFDSDDVGILGTIASRNPLFLYSDTGVYNVKVQVTNSLGCKDSTILIDAVRITELTHQLQYTDTILCATDSLNFMAHTMPVAADMVYLWDLYDTLGTRGFQKSGDSINLGSNPAGVYKLSLKHRVESRGILDACLDTIVQPIYVNGVLGNVELGATSGCTPLTLRPKFNITYNIHEGDTNSSLQYNWSVSPMTGVTISGATTANPTIVLDQELNYRISVFVTNSMGCSYFDENGAVIRVGVNAAWKPGPSRPVCLNTEKIFTDLSKGEADSIQWVINPPNYALRKIDSVNYGIRFQDTGSYVVRMVVRKNNQCIDSLQKVYTVIPFNADFAVSDTQLICAPQTFDFFNRSINADSLFWFFEDGTSIRSDTSSVSHLFTSNDTFDVSMVAYSSWGCYDTMHKADFVEIIGPTVGLSLSNARGCAPLPVDFLNESRNFSLSYIDYGDGSPLDSSGRLTHTYVINNGDSVQYFSPTLFVENANGCLEQISLDSAIRVYETPLPQIQFVTNDTICLGEEIVFSDAMVFTDSLSWYWNSGVVSTNSLDTITPLDTGLHMLSIHSRNRQLCENFDTAYVYVHAVPSFTFDTSFYLCADASSKKEVIPANPGISALYSWDMGEPSNPTNTFTIDSTTAWFTYLVSGPKQIRVQALFNNGCVNLDSTNVFIIGADSLPTVAINYVTVNDAGAVLIDYTSTNYSFFDYYELRREGVSILQENNQRTATYLDPVNVVAGNSYCYDISIADVCNHQSPVSASHCAIVLSAASTLHKTVDLTWTPYVGWNKVLEYRIFKKTTSTPYVQIATVDGSTLSYQDNKLCEDDYTYYVEAIQDQGPYSSRSNSAAIRSLYVLNNAAPNIRVATVNDLEEVEVFWSPSAYDSGTYYELSKFEDNLSNQVDLFTLTIPYLYDPNVETALHNYIYSLVEVDPCDIKTIAGRYGKTILLTAEYKDGGVHLDWTSYEEWLNGVSTYQVLVYEFGSYSEVVELNGGINSYIDRAIHQENAEGNYQYKLRAIGVDGDTSMSNVAFAGGQARAYTPNAFTPNGDGINEVFKPYVRFVVNSSEFRPTDFELDVYNRWGELVYHSTDRDAGWDGDYRGSPAPQGVYFYQLKISSASGKSYYENGNVHLLR